MKEETLWLLEFAPSIITRSTITEFETIENPKIIIEREPIPEPEPEPEPEAVEEEEEVVEEEVVEDALDEDEAALAAEALEAMSGDEDV